MTPEDPFPLDPAAIEALAVALRPIEPAPDRSAALKRRLLERIQPPDAPGLVTIRGRAEGWLEALPGVHIKLLNSEGGNGAESYLVRLDPGARAPAHDHPGFEECVVLEGSVKYLGGATLQAGDYQMAREGAHHTELVSETGALVFLRYAQPLTNYVPL